jgi:hypothetical protein
MTIPQIISVVAAVGVAAMYLWPHLPGVAAKEPDLLSHIRNIILVRDAYKNTSVTEKCNALMEALLGTKP